MKWLFLALLNLALTAQAQGAGSLRDFGVELANRADVAPWTKAEEAAILALLRSFPKELQHLGRIRVLKAPIGSKRPLRDHLAPAILYWQLELDAKSPSLLDLKRTFVHHWLHVFDAQEHVSSSAAWRSLSGWRRREYFGVEIPLLMREAENQDLRAFASETGLDSPEEDFATFGEEFFVTPDTAIEDSIACRTPDKYGFFRRQFPDYKPYLDQPHIKCRGSGEGFLDDLVFLDPVTASPVPMGPIDAKTVRGFELLYATPGVGDASEIAGHLVLRIKLANNPEADRLGIENPRDLVVSFLADTEPAKSEGAPNAQASASGECQEGFFNLGAEGKADFDAMQSVFQALKGLSGGFLTTFDRQTLQQTVKSYTVDQDRNLLRYELKLDEKQKARLLDRLYLAKKSYKAKYYFFDRNCASILVQLIGDGIGDRDVAEFDPFVVPPNALVALMIRKGLAAQSHPAFYSYRKKGQLAQELLRTELDALKLKDPQRVWPDADELLSRDEVERMRGYKALGALAINHAELSGPIYKLGSLGQDAELVHQEKSQRCERYTSEATAAIRSFQREVLKRRPKVAQSFAVDTNKAVAELYQGNEDAAARAGSSHTNLSSVTVGGGVSDGERVVSLGSALHKQDMGSRTRQSMQRATAVTLGEARLDFGRDGLRAWRVTGLSIRKFKERLDEVPNFFDPYGTFGLGLQVLDLEGRPYARESFGTLAGGEISFNLASSRFHEHYLYVAAGAALDADAKDGATTPRAALPLRVEALWTFDAVRRFQLRSSAEWRPSYYAGTLRREFSYRGSLDYLVGEPHLGRLTESTELVLRLSVERGRTYNWLLTLELNRW